MPPSRKQYYNVLLDRPEGALGYVWCVLRVQFKQVLIFRYYEHTYSLYGRYGTRRLLRYTKFVNSCV